MPPVVVLWGAFIEELEKLASFSSPAIKAPPTPGGMGSRLSPSAAAPVKPKELTSKALISTNLQKTNYTSVGTKPPSTDVDQGAEGRMIPPPVVRT
ncbi:MAG: hypothetical protein ACFFD4_39865 [Candidatus Odinarchaeota archaeon]